MRDFANSYTAPSYRRLTAFDLERIAERHVAGESDAAIATIIGCDRSTVRRARSRPSVVNQVGMLRARQRRAQAERERRVRAKMRKLQGITTDTPLTPEDVAAVPAPAGRSGGARRGAENPAEDVGGEWGFGPRGFDRPPVGYVPPDERPVRLRPRVGSRERDVLDLIVPVRAFEVPDYEAKGWERV